MKLHYRAQIMVCHAEKLGLYIRTYNPRDGATRYKFFVRDVDDYNSGGWIYLAIGFKEACTFFEGFEQGMQQARWRESLKVVSMTNFDRKSWLIGLMFRHFPLLREDQIVEYSVEEMEKVLRENGVNLD